MANLNSPGVQVSVIDESFYTPATPGTVPLIFVATASNKSNAAKTGTAPGTLAKNVSKVWEITSQRDLTDTFGTPLFVTDSSLNPSHGNEMNEYGLQAAYSLLGVSSKVYVIRADADLSQLEAQTDAPTGAPVSGQYWVDTNKTLFGISEWDATNQVFVDKTPLIINDDTVDTDATGLMVPKSSFGTKGSYAAIVTGDNQNAIYYKNNDNQWVLVGTNNDANIKAAAVSSFTSTSWLSSFPVATSTGLGSLAGQPTFTVNGHIVTVPVSPTAASIASAINNAVGNFHVGAKVNSSGKLELYTSNTTTGVTVSGNAIGGLGLTTGTYAIPAISIQPHYQFPQYGTESRPSGSVYIKTTTANRGASWIVKLYNGTTAAWSTVSAPVYAGASDAIKALDSAGGTNIAVGTLFVESNYDHGTGSVSAPKLANFKLYRRSATSPTTITGSIDVTSFTVTGAKSFTIAETLAGTVGANSTATITISAGAGTVLGSDVVTAISNAGLTNVSASLNSDGTMNIKHKLGGEIYLSGDVGVLGFTAYDLSAKTGTANLFGTGDYDTYPLVGSNWKSLSYEAKGSAPYTTPANGTLWYSAGLTEVDILINDGTAWKGYKNVITNCSPNGPIISATEPAAETGQSDGTALVDGDIWVDISDSDQYGKNIYVWNNNTKKWVKQDVTDQESPTGWLFADARWSGAGQDTEPDSIKKLLTYDYVDPDAPDPALYPQGMRLWNTRRSGFNIKKYSVNHIDITENNGTNKRYINDPMDGAGQTTPYNADRWISVSPNNADGSGTFGRHAQRAFVVAKLKAEIDTNQDARDTDTRLFNLIACPGYPEVIQNMISLNLSRSYTAFVIGDTPMRLKATGTELGNWGNNTAKALDNGDDGAVSHNEYMAMFYPSGYTNDNSGNYIVVPPSHMMLRTIAVSDQQSYQWFAPSGTKRGVVTNATSVGYIENGEFKQTSLPPGLRDTLASVKINPIATLNGVGIVNFGNYSRASGASSLDRINVSRLVAYLRRQLDVLARPFLFEPNDRTTRNEIKQTAERLMLELVGQRALYDFIVVCDESNNTSTTIDRSELHMDIAIEPVKAVEFIYIPLRLKNTGEIKAGL